MLTGCVRTQTLYVRYFLVHWAPDFQETTAPQANIDKRFVLEIGYFKNCTLLTFYWLFLFW